MYEVFYKYIQSKTEIDQESFAEFCYFFKLKKVKRNEIILSEGDICNNNFFVNTGCLKFFSIDEEGKEHTRYFAFDGKFGTSLTSFIEQKPSSEFIQAIEPTELLTISRQDFFHLVNNFTPMNFIYRDILEMAYITSQKRIYSLQGQTALSQLKWLLEYQPKILSRLSSKQVAAYLGITPYTLSRLKSII